MKIRKTKKTMWIIIILWFMSNIIAYFILSPIMFLVNLAWLILLINIIL